MKKDVNICGYRRNEGDFALSGAVVISAPDLFRGANEVRIHFRDDEYRLRITKNRKLILTK